MIDQATVDKILDAANIVDVVSDFVTLRKRGVNLVGLCPFHDDKSPSFYVSPSKNICKCFACGEGGTPVHFIMKHEQLTYYEALRYLAKKFNIEIQERELTDKEKQEHSERESLFMVNDWAQKYFTNILNNHLDGRTIGQRYFTERGFREDTIRKFQLGYCLDQPDALYQEAVKAGFKKELLEKTGLIIAYDNGGVRDRFRGRVMFPVQTLSGKIVAFGGRILKKNEKTAKYVNSPESEIYHKSNELYGIFFAKQAIVKCNKCFLVEGYTDVISMHQSGVENVVASSGTSLTDGQIRMIHRFTNNITVLYDGDAPGIKAAVRGIDMLLEVGMNIKVVLLPDGEDPDSFARSHSASEFAEYIKGAETDFIRFKTQLLLADAGSDPIKRAALIRDILQSIALIPDTISRSVYVHECSNSFEIDEQILLNEVSKIRTDRQNGSTAGKVVTILSGRSQNPAPTTVATAEIQKAQQERQATPVTASPYEQAERTLIYYIIRYGEEIFYDETDDDNSKRIVLHVADFILSDLQRDDLFFHNPFYELIAEEAARKCTESGFVSNKYFLSHVNPSISKIATDMMIDPYQLSKMFEQKSDREKDLAQLHQNVLAAVYELKNVVILTKINEVQADIKKDQETGDMNGIMEHLKQLSQLNDIKNALNKQLGERIVLKL